MKNQKQSPVIDFSNVVIVTPGMDIGLIDTEGRTTISTIHVLNNVFFDKKALSAAIEEQLHSDADFYIIVKGPQQKKFDSNPMDFIKQNLEFLTPVTKQLSKSDQPPKI